MAATLGDNAVRSGRYDGQRWQHGRHACFSPPPASKLTAHSLPANENAMMRPFVVLQLHPRIGAGERPHVPPSDQLPGPDTASFAGLDAYIALME